MSRKLVSSLAAVGAIALSLPVSATAAATAQDARCFMLGNIFAQKADKPEGRQLAQSTAIYYLGKLQAMNDADLRKAMLAQQNVQIAPAAAVTEMQACARGVQASLTHLQSLAPRPAAPAPAPAPPRK